MIREIITIAISVLSATGILGIGTRSILNRMQKQDARQKALEYGVKVSGATIHFVNEKADAGAIILQGAVDVANDETPESLQKKIMENVEWKLLPKAVSLFCEGRLHVENERVRIQPDAE